MKTKKIIAAVFAAVLVLTLVPAAFAVDFTDVPENHPYKAAIDYCQADDIIKGTGNGAFMPDSKLTRAQFAVIWCRSLMIDEVNHGFSDITGLKNYYDSSAIVLNSLGIVSGVSSDKFSPGGFMTREQLAVIVKRTYMIEAENEDAYQQYTDSASISEWAREGVSACINARVFEDLYDGESFKPAEPVTRAEICQLIYNLFKPAYFVSVDTLAGGTIAADPEIAYPGELITLTIVADSGMQLKDGTLKYNDVPISGSTFTMPAEDVLITAEFENK